MTTSLILFWFRKYRQLQKEYIAKELGLSYDSYNDIETGKIRITGILAQTLSNFYQAPIELFIYNETPYLQQAEVLYNNCTFISSDGSCSGYVNHQYNDRGIDEIIFAKNEEIKFLKKQVELVQQQNTRLTELLSEKVKGIL